MKDKYSFVPNQVNLLNICSFSAKLSSAMEQKICDFSEIASDTADYVIGLLNEGLNFYEIFSMLGESIVLHDDIEFDASLEDNISTLKSFLKSSESFDKSVFASLLIERLALKGHSLSEKSFFRSKAGDETFVYVKNAFSDEAYDVFSQEFADPRVRYADSFKEAVRLVSDNAVTFCLLPIEERGVRLPSVEELIFRNDCKINAVIPVFGYDGNADLKYALVSKNILISDYTEDDDRYFEIRIPVESEDITSIMISAEEFGIRLYRVNTLSFKTEDGEAGYFSVVLKSVSGDFTKLLVFLNLFIPEYIPVGIYKNLE